ncbi:sialate O-acetylesterase, partial [Desulfonatronum sp. SC1]|uniref:sialate O-acetylesterase n=1 Tax=Desulfonatronum sp. SC1 TaxID=2109626 RepID=UPI000D3FD41F
YQGESNVGRANQYMRLKSMLVTDWRKQFDNETMPFYYVQIAPWRYGDAEGTSSANLREAQRRMLVIPNTGMAVTLDIGNVDNIHPANKTDVGERLALWALDRQYNRAIAFSGPEPEAVTISGNELT